MYFAVLLEDKSLQVWCDMQVPSSMCDINGLGGQVQMNYLGLPMHQVCYLNFGR